MLFRALVFPEEHIGSICQARRIDVHPLGLGADEAAAARRDVQIGVVPPLTAASGRSISRPLHDNCGGEGDKAGLSLDNARPTSGLPRNNRRYF